ncbi:MAG: hypothetical protein IKI11_07735, partial [Neisseriaceae bacterium]|nr:hypothetical protein [Neisseriaceae bacterium]
LLNKTTNTRDRIIIIFLLQKMFSLKDCHCSNWQQIKETIGNMYREIVTFHDVPKTDDMTITYSELTEPKDILINLALSGNYMKFNNKIYQEFIKNPYQLTQLE